jgi:hypothetical protein
MKTKLTTLKLILILGFMLPMSTFAKSYALYLCGGATATLQPAIAGVALADQVIWVDVTGGTNTTLKSGTGADMNYSIPNNLAVGEHTYRVHSVSASPNSCTGDYTEFVFYVLPPITVTLSNPTNANYCEAASGTNTSSSITATTNTLDPSLTDVSFNYLWTGTKGGTTVDVTTIGTGATTSTYVLNTTAPETYIFKAAANYAVSSGVLKSGDNSGCAVTSAASSPIKVTPKPAAPTITIL